MGDRLESLLRRFELKARVFHNGELCDSVNLEASAGVIYVHVLKAGRLTIERTVATGDLPAGEQIHADAPSVVFNTRPMDHCLIPSSDVPTEIVCGEIDFGLAGHAVLSLGLPPVIVLNAEQGTRLSPIVDLVLCEAENRFCGQQVALDRLCELLVLELLRELMSEGAHSSGLLAGLADPNLLLALNAIHNQPDHAWTLDQLATAAGMSRAAFAARFKQVVGISVGQYLTTWRISLAQSLLRKGQTVSQTALDVGYQNPASMARVFRTEVGLSPREWAKQG